MKICKLNISEDDNYAHQCDSFKHWPNPKSLAPYLSYCLNCKNHVSYKKRRNK